MLYIYVHCVSIGCPEDEIEVWMDEDESPVSNYAELLHTSASHPQMSVLVNWILIFVQFLRFKYGISDAITSLLLKFLKTMFVVLGTFSDICKDIGDSLPGTLHLLRSGRSLLKNHILRYVVCPKCFHIYLQNQCTIESSAHQPWGKLCPYRRFPMIVMHICARRVVLSC